MVVVAVERLKSFSSLAKNERFGAVSGLSRFTLIRNAPKNGFAGSAVRLIVYAPVVLSKTKLSDVRSPPAAPLSPAGSVNEKDSTAGLAVAKGKPARAAAATRTLPSHLAVACIARPPNT